MADAERLQRLLPERRGLGRDVAAHSVAGSSCCVFEALNALISISPRTSVAAMGRRNNKSSRREKSAAKDGHAMSPPMSEAAAKSANQAPPTAQPQSSALVICRNK